MTKLVKGDFSQGRISTNIIYLAVPIIISQVINLIYNVVDRIYIGHITEVGTFALTGLGLCFPIISFVTAFSNLIGYSGGIPLCNIERGKKNNEEASYILGNCFSLTLIIGFALTILILVFNKPLLYLFGASTNTITYAKDYLFYYSFGTIFSLISTVMTAFITAQGFAIVGMISVIAGSIINIVLDPIFIFHFGLGVKGAAIATVISQLCTGLYTVYFLFSKKPLLRLKLRYMKLEIVRVIRIVTLGFSGFIMGATNSLVQIVYNKMAFIYGGDIFIAIITVVNSVREIFDVPSRGLASGASPVISYNYGAKEIKRVIEAISFTFYVSLFFASFLAIIVLIFPQIFLGIFSKELSINLDAIITIRLYFIAFGFMAFQHTAQIVYTSLKKTKQAVFFSLFRKAMIVLPLAIILPRYIGVYGIVLAEPISNVVGGLISYTTMKILTNKEFSSSK